MPFERAAEEGPANGVLEGKGRLYPGMIEELAVGGPFVEVAEPRWRNGNERTERSASSGRAREVVALASLERGRKPNARVGPIS
jgi:hypothetical protein